MTVDHLLQANLDDWSDCLRGRKKCVAGRADLSLIDSIAVVVMDASTGDLLGLLCQGTQCRTKGAEEAEPINALLIEAPPASTTKLLHAMVLGKSIRVDAQELRNHLKTSVQLDGGVTKPNEWWERQVICDSVPLRRQAIGLPTGLSCDVMDGVNRLAREIGFNQHCDASEQPICGRMGLGDTMQSHWLQGFAGRLALGGSSPRQSLLTWHEYNQIRMGHQREPKGKTGQDAYWATAQSVQSVIGGGDSRIGALGLAHLGAYVWSVAEGRSPPQPKLLARVDSLGRERPPDIQRREAGRRDREAAALVFSGMQQVVEGEVPGWKGAGTAHAALRAAFGKSCAQACGVAAKTGTASFKDSKHAGTTLMVATVDMKHLSRWVGGEPKLLKGRKLALGVIAHVTNPEYRIHAASEIGIAMVSSFMKP
jgi:hypothetical protein